jgi:hypothetical protein
VKTIVLLGLQETLMFGFDTVIVQKRDWIRTTKTLCYINFVFSENKGKSETRY